MTFNDDVQENQTNTISHTTIESQQNGNQHLQQTTLIFNHDNKSLKISGNSFLQVESMDKQDIDDISTKTQGVRLGKCKWFNVAKGWGFITPNDGGQEVFVHQSVLQMSGFRSLGEGEEVEFECKTTERGYEATRVSGPNGTDCSGSSFRPRPKKRFRRIRCYNCGSFANHIAAKCSLGPQPKKCHNCKSEDHLVADCPKKKSETQTKDKSKEKDIEEEQD